MKVNRNLTLKPIPSAVLSDGSFLARLRGRVDGQMQELTVRVIDCQLRGFRPLRSDQQSEG